jgi:hypothetical protein
MRIRAAMAPKHQRGERAGDEPLVSPDVVRRELTRDRTLT